MQEVQTCLRSLGADPVGYGQEVSEVRCAQSVEAILHVQHVGGLARRRVLPNRNMSNGDMFALRRGNCRGRKDHEDWYQANTVSHRFLGIRRTRATVCSRHRGTAWRHGRASFRREARSWRLAKMHWIILQPRASLFIIQTLWNGCR